MTLRRLVWRLGGLADLWATCNGEVVNVVTRAVVDSLQLVTLIVGYALLPYLYLIDGILHLVLGILVLRTVYHTVAWETIGSRKLFVAPEINITVGMSELRILRCVFGIVHHLTVYNRGVVLVPVISSDMSFFQFRADNGLPVWNQRVQDICLRIDECSTEVLANGETVFFCNLERAVILFEESKYTTFAEE